jgi:Fe-S cluster assembly protein SufD
MTTNTLPGFTVDSVRQLSAARNEPDWLLERRLHAWQIFEDLPMPTRQDEEWRRTDISKLRLNELTPFAPADGQVRSPLRLNGSNAGLLSQSNSATVEQSLSEDLAQQGVIFTDLHSAVREHPDLVRPYLSTEAIPAEAGKFQALNAALWSGGVFLYIPKGVQFEIPVRALYGLTAPGSGLFTHTLIVLEVGARGSYIEEYASEGIDRQTLNAGAVEVFLRQDAHFTFITLQEWMGNVIDISTQRALMDRDATLDWLVVGMGEGLTKTNIESALRGPGANSQMLGILWGYGKQQTDYHTVQDHIAPHTTSDLLYKSALTDEARSVFSGRIRVDKGAQGTDAYQANRNILLSEKASAYPSPNLEIEANEVRCTHGATVGKVDQDQLFYLMSRGIPLDVATRIVVEGFYEDVLQREPVASIRDNLRELIARKLDAS